MLYIRVLGGGGGEGGGQGKVTAKSPEVGLDQSIIMEDVIAD